MLLSATCFGLVPVLAKQVYDGGADAGTSLMVRFALAAVVLLAMGRLRGEARPGRRATGGLLLLGSLGYGVQSLAYFLALERVPAGLATLLLYAYPAAVVLLVAALARRRPAALPLSCVVAVSAGVALTVGPVEGGQGTGVLLGLGAAAAYAVLLLVSPRYLSRAGPFTGTGVVCAATAAFDAAVVTATGPSWPSGTGPWLALVAIALIGGAVAITAFFAGLLRLPASDVAVLSTLEPVVAVGAAALLLGDRLRPAQLLGGLVVLAAVLVLARRPGTPPDGEVPPTAGVPPPAVSPAGTPRPGA